MSRRKKHLPKNYRPQVRNPKPAYKVVFAHAHFRESECEAGLGCAVDFRDRPGEGIEFCRGLERRARSRDARGCKPTECLEELRRLSAQHRALTSAEQSLAFDCIYWLETRGNRTADEHNGCVFNWIVGRTLCSGEQNPVTIDPVVVAFDGRGIDATEAMRAATTLADPGGTALRAIADHARAQPPTTSPLKTYYMILSARTHSGTVYRRLHMVLPNDPRRFIPSEQEAFLARVVHECGLSPADLTDTAGDCATLGIWESEDECVAAYRKTVEMTNASPIPEYLPISITSDKAGRYGRSKA